MRPDGLLGHTRVQTTARYAHRARDSIRATAARITGSIGGNLSSAQGVDDATKQGVPTICRIPPIRAFFLETDQNFQNPFVWSGISATF